jgi:hypothetical protein
MARKLLRLSKRGLGLSKRGLSLSRRRLSLPIVRTIPIRCTLPCPPWAVQGDSPTEETEPICHYIPFAGEPSPDPELNYPEVIEICRPLAGEG